MVIGFIVGFLSLFLALGGLIYYIVIKYSDVSSLLLSCLARLTTAVIQAYSILCGCHPVKNGAWQLA